MRIKNFGFIRRECNCRLSIVGRRGFKARELIFSRCVSENIVHRDCLNPVDRFGKKSSVGNNFQAAVGSFRGKCTFASVRREQKVVRCIRLRRCRAVKAQINSAERSRLNKFSSVRRNSCNIGRRIADRKIFQNKFRTCRCLFLCCVISDINLQRFNFKSLFPFCFNRPVKHLFVIKVNNHCFCRRVNSDRHAVIGVFGKHNRRNFRTEHRKFIFIECNRFHCNK